MLFEIRIYLTNFNLICLIGEDHGIISVCPSLVASEPADQF